MCMKNINATVNLEALNEENTLLTFYGNDDQKAIPVNDSKARVFLAFNYSIINGKDGFFNTHNSLFFQIRIFDKLKTHSIILKEYDENLDTKNKKYRRTEFVDFISNIKTDIIDLDLHCFEINETCNEYYLAVLVRDETGKRDNTPWIIQSVSAIKFKVQQ